MHQSNPHNGPDQQSNLEQVLRATLSFIKTKIITNENDKIGIVLFGCDKNQTENSLKFKHIHVLYSLDVPEASLIKKLETKISTITQDHGFFDEGVAVPDDDASQINSSLVKMVQGSSLVNASQASRPAGSQLGSSSQAGSIAPRSPLFEALWVCH